MAGGSPGRLAPPFRRLTQKQRRQATESFFVRPSLDTKKGDSVKYAVLGGGENELEVMVVNSWYNRVKGDQLHPDRRQHTKTNIRLVGGKGYRNPGLSSSGLSPSGLLGPVEIVSERPDRE